MHDEWADHNLRGLFLGANDFFADAIHIGLLLEATAPRLSAWWGTRGVSAGPGEDETDPSLLHNSPGSPPGVLLSCIIYFNQGEMPLSLLLETNAIKYLPLVSSCNLVLHGLLPCTRNHTWSYNSKE